MPLPIIVLDSKFDEENIKISCNLARRIRRKNERDIASLLQYADTIKESNARSQLCGHIDCI